MLNPQSQIILHFQMRRMEKKKAVTKSYWRIGGPFHTPHSGRHLWINERPGLGFICLSTCFALRPWSRLSVQLTSMTSAWSQPAGPSCQLLLPPPMGGGGQAARNGSPVVSSLHTLWPAERRGSLDAHEWTPTGIAPRLSHPKEGAGSAWWKSEQEASTQSPGQTIVPDKLLPLCRLGPYRGNKWNQMTTKTSTKEPQNPMTWGGRKLRSWHLVPSLHGKGMGRQWKQC